MNIVVTVHGLSISCYNLYYNGRKGCENMHLKNAVLILLTVAK